jgi:hypothetical protein
MDGYSKKEYTQYNEIESDDEEDDWEQSQSNVKYTFLKEEEFDED